MTLKLPNLSRRQKRSREPLPPAEAPEAIPEARVTGARQANPATSGSGGGGPVSPLVEQEYTGETFYSLTSSDGLFVLEYGDTTTLIDNDGSETGSTYVIKHRDPSA